MEHPVLFVAQDNSLPLPLLRIGYLGEDLLAVNARIQSQFTHIDSNNFSNFITLTLRLLLLLVAELKPLLGLKAYNSNWFRQL